MVTYQRLLQVLKNNTSVEKFCFPRGGSDLKTGMHFHSSMLYSSSSSYPTLDLLDRCI